MDIRVSDFNSRADIDAHVQALPSKEGVTLVGTELELRYKQLSERTTVWGVPCKIIMGDKESNSMDAEKEVGTVDEGVKEAADTTVGTEEETKPEAEPEE